MSLSIDPEILIILIINVYAFLVMMVDKIKSRKRGYRRISEGKIFFMAAAFGSMGVYLGILIFRHKVKKWYFVIGIPLIMLQNAALLYLINSFL